MKISLNWLNDFVDLKEISKKENVSSKQELANVLADHLTGVGFEVEEILDCSKHLKNVVVGKILKIEKHKDAERLFVCKVNIGNRDVQIITSATNVFEGALVPVALDGADLANGIKIKSSKIRGELSEGMFCSGEELGISEGFYEGASVNGILIFKDDFEPGAKVEDVLLLDDVVLDVSITPNRPDAMSVVGIAREICAIYRTKILKQDLSYKTTKKSVEDFVSVDDRAFDLCPRYMASAVENVKIERSPLFIRARLFCCDVHPINNIVDITNYVLFEYGQPMHAFDASLLEGKKIVVRRAEAGEEISCLNGNTYKLSSSNLVIADAKKPVVIAGVIGGLNSCINDQTKTVIFESACFERSSIRRTSRAFGVRTDSSARFEKGVDTASQEVGMKRALSLISKLGCGEIAEGIVDEKQEEAREREVVVSKNKIDSILGVSVNQKDVKEILESLGIGCKIEGDTLILNVPAFRLDIENDNDVAEEVIRMYGYDIYDNCQNGERKTSETIGKYDPVLKLQREIKGLLIDRGFYEINSYSLVPLNAHEKLGLVNLSEEVVKVKNPFSDELGALRVSLCHNLLTNINYNFNRNNKEIKIYEAGRTFHAKSNPISELPVEKDVLAFASTCLSDDFFTFKGIVENIVSKYDVSFSLKYSNASFLHPGISADLFAEEKLVARFGKINPVVAKNYDVPENIFYGEIFCNEILTLPEKKFEVKKISKFPAVERDLALVVDEDVTVGELENLIRQCCGKYLEELCTFDIYRSKQLEGKKSIAFRIKLISDEKTLSEEDISKIINKILKRAEENFGAKLR